MKTLILSCIAVLTLASFVGCSDSDKSTSTTTTTSAPMQTDSKNMQPSH